MCYWLLMLISLLLYYLFKYVAYLRLSALHACCIALYIVSFFLSLRCAMLYIALLPSVREGAVSDFLHASRHQ